VKSSKSETQHEIHKTYSHIIKHHQASQRPNIECTEHEKDFEFAVNFVKLSKLATQHVIHKIYLHVIKTPPSKSETQYGVHGT